MYASIHIGAVASFWPRFRFDKLAGDLVNVDTHHWAGCLNVKLFEFEFEFGVGESKRVRRFFVTPESALTAVSRSGFATVEDNSRCESHPLSSKTFAGMNPTNSRRKHSSGITEKSRVGTALRVGTVAKCGAGTAAAAGCYR